MSESPFPFGAVAVAEPPLQSAAFDEPVSDRRRLALFGGVAALVLAAVGAYFLLFSGGGSSDTGSVVPTHHRVAAPSAPGATTAKVVPPAYNAVTGRDPFKPLYVAPVAAPAQAAQPAPAAPVAPAPATQPSGSSTGTTTTTTKPAAPVWVELDSQVGTKSATLRVAYGDATTRVFQNVVAPAPGGRTVFAKYFALLAVHTGYVTVQYGDGKPFDLKQGFASRHFV